MKRNLFFIFSLSLMLLPRWWGDSLTSLMKRTQKIASEITNYGRSYSNLKELTAIGHRLSGSPGAEKAVAWAKKKFESYGLDRVVLQPMMAPHWVRGETESATILLNDKSIPLKITALGGSVGTGSKEVVGEVLEVKSLDEVNQFSDKVRGKIVFYNRPMESSINEFEAYGKALDQRGGGAARAAQFGAIAVLVRSMTPLADDDHPHTGMLTYADDLHKIPAAALSTHAANTLSETLKTNSGLKVALRLSAEMLPMVSSYNVIGELTGRDLPNEYVVVGGHLDSWDLGTGAHDDGAGVVQSIEVLRSFRTLKLRPRRTVRAVLFMSEEFGGFGGKEYAQQVAIRHEKHIAALESDRGGFAPGGFTVAAADDKVKTFVGNWIPYLTPVHATQFTSGEGGTDVSPLEEMGTATFGLVPATSGYFALHHSSLDRIDAIDPKDLSAGAAAMAVFIYLAAELGVSAQ